MSKGAEFFVQDNERGPREDADLHAPILDNAAADRIVSEAAIRRALRNGLSRETAERLYGHSPCATTSDSSN